MIRCLVCLIAVLLCASTASPHHVKASFYQAVPGQTDRTPELSACGKTLPAWKQLATSRDLARALPCGTRVEVRLARPVGGVRVFRAVVWDRLGAGARQQVDVLVSPREPARQFGTTTATLRVLSRP